MSVDKLKICNSAKRSWRYWPNGIFQPGDLVHVDWKCNGFLGTAHKETFFLLLDTVNALEGNEVWQVLQLDADERNVKFSKIFCNDKQEDSVDEWHEVTLLSKSLIHAEESNSQDGW